MRSSESAVNAHAGARPVLAVDRPRPGVVQLTLNRPHRLNALNAELVTSLFEAFDEIAADQSCRAVVLTGAGRGFCAGADVSEFERFLALAKSGETRPFWGYARWASELVSRLRGVPQPVVIAVNGVAVGGGLSMTAASDIRFAADTATFAAAGQRIGLSAAEMGVGWLLPRLIGLARAQELLLTGRTFSAQEAEAIGLIARVVPEAELVEAAIDQAEALASGPAFATSITKAVIWAQLETGSLTAAVNLENGHQAMLVQGGEHKEAVAAFLDGRMPDYRDIGNGD